MRCISHPLKTIIVLLAGWLAAFSPPPRAAITSAKPAARPGKPQQLLTLPQTATDSTVALLWDKPEDYVTVKEYGVYRDGQPVVTVARTNATIGHLQPATAYTFAVQAKNAAGQQGPATARLKAHTRATGKIETTTTPKTWYSATSRCPKETT